MGILARTYIRMGKVPSHRWLFGYFIAIPCFAFIYFSMPNQFYHSTLRYDPRISVLSNEAENILAEGLSRQLAERGDYRKDENLHVNVKGEKWAIAHDWVAVYMVGEKDVSFDVLLYLFNIDKQEGKEALDLKELLMLAKVRLKYSEGRMFDQVKPNLGFGILVDFEIVDDRSLTQQGFTLEDAFGYVDRGEYSHLRGVPTKVSIPIDPERAAIFADIENANMGLVQYEVSSFVRMIYFSVSTITTLGYGDIVPISSLGRLLVIVESILGVLLVGLFLNSLAHKA